VRRRGGGAGHEGEDGVWELLLVSSSRNRSVWVLPKGGWETDEDQHSGAQRETWEEAGVRGTIHAGGYVGQFEYVSSKKSPPRAGNLEAESSAPAADGAYSPNQVFAHIHVLDVHEEAARWPEEAVRDRKWFTFDEAMDACRREWMLRAIAQARELVESGNAVAAARGTGGDAAEAAGTGTELSR